MTGEPEPRGGTRPGRWDRHLLLVVLATVVGVAMVVAGWLIQGRDYVPGLLLQVGTSLALLVPLLALGSIIEQRLARDLADVKSQVRETTVQLASLGQLTREGLRDRQRSRDLLLQQAERGPTPQRLAPLLREAAELGAVVATGPRVRLGRRATWLRFHATGDDIDVTVEGRGGRPTARVAWTPAESPQTLARRIDEKIGDAGAQSVLPELTVALERLVTTLRVAIAARTGESRYDLGAVVELPNDQWAITEDGLRSPDHDVHLGVDDLRHNRHDWAAHLSSRHPWADEEQLRDAVRTATDLLRD
jgi:hypothetical protein